VLSLAAGEPDFATPGHIRRAAVAAMEAGYTGYAPSAGVPVLREAIRRSCEEQLGLNYSDEQVVVSCGAKQCLYNACMALLQPGDQAIIQAPYWVSYPEQIRLCGAEPVVLAPPESGSGLDLDAMERALTEKSRVMLVNSPCNPTGHVLEASDLQAIARLALDHDLVVISDDIYDKLLYDGRRFESIVRLVPEMAERTIIVNGVSKSYSMTGWRLGWALGPREVIGSMRKIQDQSTSNATTFVQHAAVAALESPDEVVEEMVKSFDDRRQRLVELLEEIPGIECKKPAGTFYAWADCSGLTGRKLDGEIIGSTLKLAELLLDKKRVAVVPGEAFGCAGFLRISFAAAEDVIEQAASRIGAFVKNLA